MRLIDADVLKEAFADMREGYPIFSDTEMVSTKDIASIIDNAPTVEAYSEEDMCDTTSNGYDIGYDFAKAKYERPQGECKNCKHFKESLCENSPYGWCSIRRTTQEGDLETQVPKDYYCSWYEKGGAE